MNELQQVIGRDRVQQWIEGIYSTTEAAETESAHLNETFPKHRFNVEPHQIESDVPPDIETVYAVIETEHLNNWATAFYTTKVEAGAEAARRNRVDPHRETSFGVEAFTIDPEK